MKILLFAIFILTLWGCTASPEKAAKQACDCKRAEYEISLAADEAAKVKLTELARKCKEEFDEKYGDIKSDKEFYDAYNKELSKGLRALEKEFGAENEQPQSKLRGINVE